MQLSLLLVAMVALGASPHAKPESAMDPSVRNVVHAMQAFYEHNRDFEAHFEQSYHYAQLDRTQHSSGTVVIRKARKLGKGKMLAPAMRWDYQKPEPKSIVVTGSAVYMYDPGAEQLTKTALDMNQLSASVTFLWGQGNLAEAFVITRDKTRPGLVLTLVPKKSGSPFARIEMQVDPKTDAVISTTVVDPNGSRNHMDFTDVKTDQNIPDSRFELNVPKDTQVIDMTRPR